MSPDYGLNIAEAFKKYLKTGDSKLIEGYSAKELRTAISRLSPYYDHNKQWYREVERRIEELFNQEAQQREKSLSILSNWKTHWMDKIIIFGLGYIVGVFL